MNILKVLRSAAKGAEAKQEAATRELQAITTAIGALKWARRAGTTTWPAQGLENVCCRSTENFDRAEGAVGEGEIDSFAPLYV